MCRVDCQRNPQLLTIPLTHYLSAATAGLDCFDGKAGLMSRIIGSYPCAGSGSNIRVGGLCETAIRATRPAEVRDIDCASRCRYSTIRLKQHSLLLERMNDSEPKCDGLQAGLTFLLSFFKHLRTES